MKRILALLIVAGLIASISTYAQNASVVYNYDRNYFNENQPLPAETHFLLSGMVGADINRVDVAIYRAKGRDSRKSLHEATWLRPKNNVDGGFSMPVNFMLRGGSNYDVALTYYRNLTPAEQEYLKVRLFQTLDAYITSSLEVNKGSIKLLRHSRQIIKDLNSIVEDGLQIYKSRNGYEFEGFSDVVKNKLEQIEEADLGKGKFIFGKKKRESKALYANQLIKDIQKVVHNETEQFTNSELLTVYETKYVDDYKAKRDRGAISLNVGYGAVYLDGDFDDLDIDGAPYVGVSLPFGRKAFSKFFGNASLSLGVLLTNLENEEGETVTGPLIKRPVYVGLGYKLFRFLRLNAGATLLEIERANGDEDLKVRPFVGISAEINISATLGDK